MVELGLDVARRSKDYCLPIKLDNADVEMTIPHAIMILKPAVAFHQGPYI